MHAHQDTLSTCKRVHTDCHRSRLKPNVVCRSIATMVADYTTGPLAFLRNLLEAL